MKHFSKVLIFVLLICFSTTSFSQIFGLKAGSNLSKMVVKDDQMDLSDDFQLKPGLLFGPTVDFPLCQPLSLETGIMLSSKGFKDTYEESYQGGFYESKTTLNLWYIDIPILFKWNIPINDEFSIYPALGPYISIGIKGKSKYESKSNYGDESGSSDIEWGTDEESDMLRRFDAGIMFGGGIEYKAFQLSVYYNLGIANISAYTEEGTTIKNNVLQIALGYRFISKTSKNLD